MQPTIFAVGDEPYCLWDVDVADRTRLFLDRFDPGFFEYLLNAYLETEDKKRASVGIRLTLHHATETLFSLIGALVQAPGCPYAWIARCRTEELRAVVQRIARSDRTLITKISPPAFGWDEVARVVFQTFEPGSDKQARTVQGFSQVWGYLAGEFLRQATIDEYNAAKHGFRARPGGFTLSFGLEHTPGAPPPAAEMKTIGHSDLGLTFYKVDKLEGKGGRHIRSRRTAVNWSLEKDALLLQLVQCSIQNVVSALKVLNGAPAGSCEFVRPADDADFKKPWTYSVGTTGSGVLVPAEQ